MMAQRTMREIWETVRDYLELMVTVDVYEIYLRPLQATGWSNGMLTMAAPTERVRLWCELRFNRMIEREICLEAGRPVRVVYVLAEPGPAAVPASPVVDTGGNHAN